MKKLNIENPFNNMNIMSLFSIAFILGFFILGQSIHKLFFYIFILFPFFIIFSANIKDISTYLKSNTLKICALYMLYTGITLFWSQENDLGSTLKCLRKILYVLCFILLTCRSVLLDKEYLKYLFQLMCISASIVAIVGIAYYFANHSFPHGRISLHGHLGNPIRGASLYGVISLISIYMIQKRIFIIGYPSLLLSLAYITLCQSRGPFIALILTIFLFSLITIISNFKDNNKVKNLIIGLFGISIILFSLAFTYHEIFIYRDTHLGIAYRFEAWSAFIDKIGTNVFFGHGVNAQQTFMIESGQALHSHNFFIATTYEGGIISLLILVLLISYSLIYLFKKRKEKLNLLVFNLILFGTLCQLTDGHNLFNRPKSYWIFFWLPISLAISIELLHKTKPTMFSSKYLRKGPLTEKSFPKNQEP